MQIGELFVREKVPGGLPICRAPQNLPVGDFAAIDLPSLKEKDENLLYKRNFSLLTARKPSTGRFSQIVKNGKFAGGFSLAKTPSCKSGLSAFAIHP